MVWSVQKSLEQEIRRETFEPPDWRFPWTKQGFYLGGPKGSYFKECGGLLTTEHRFG